MLFTFSNFQFMPNYPKQEQLKNKFFVLFNSAWIILSFTISTLPLTSGTRGLFVKKCITMCANMNNLFFKHRFIYTNNSSLIHITTVSFSCQYSFNLFLFFGILAISKLTHLHINRSHFALSRLKIRKY